MSKNTKITIMVLIVAIVIGFGSYFIYITKYFSSQPFEVYKDENTRPVTENTATTTPPEKKILKEITSLSGYRLYKNAEFGFEIQYPNLWTVSEENIENVRGENTKAFYFKKPDSDLRFVILPRDGLSYGLPDGGDSSDVVIGGLAGSQTKWTLSDGRRLWLLYPKYGLHNWSEDIGRIDIQSSATDPLGDTAIFEKMLNSFKLAR